MSDFIDKKESRLKPCPRCGKIPELTWEYYNADYDKVIYTICECNFNGILSFTEEEAINNWNKKCSQYLADEEKIKKINK